MVYFLSNTTNNCTVRCGVVDKATAFSCIEHIFGMGILGVCFYIFREGEGYFFLDTA